MSWRVARSLDVLRDEIDAYAPRRSTISDGSIGDAAHASRTSDHNPWVTRDGIGIVRARDFTHDTAGGLDCRELAEALAEMMIDAAHPALGSGAYIIWQRRILSTDRLREGWRDYTGSNPHAHHLHLSVAYAPAGYDSPAPWHLFDTPEQDDDMFTDDDRRKLEAIHRTLGPDGVVRAKLVRTNQRLKTLIAQGKANRRELEELAADLNGE